MNLIQKYKYESIGLAILLLLIVGYFFFGGTNGLSTLVQTVETGATSTTLSSTSTGSVGQTKGPSSGYVAPAGYHSYSNTEYGFSVAFPPTVKTLTAFSTFRNVSNNWRVYAGPAQGGKGVVDLSIYSIDQGDYFVGNPSLQKYPLFFAADVRIGVSPDVKNCYLADASVPDEVVTSTTINGIAFRHFSTSQTGTSSGVPYYLQVESYRTVHNNMCYVIEQFKNGSTIHDPKMGLAASDATLAGYYATAGTIVKTFRFIK